MVDIDDPPGESFTDFGAQDLHVAGKDYQINLVVLDEAEELCIGLEHRLGGHRDAVELDALALDDVAQILMVGNDDCNVGLELPRVVAHEQVEEAVVVL